MDITLWYAIALSGLIACYIVPFISLKIFQKTGPRVKHQFLKHVYYPPIHRYLRGSEQTTRFDLLVIIIFLGGVVLGTGIKVQDVNELRRRSGLIAVITFIPLSLGARMNLLADSCEVRLGTYRRIHRWLGGIFVAEGLVHTAAAVSLQKLDISKLRDVGGLTADIIMGLLLLSLVTTLRRYSYEIYVWLHWILTSGLLATLFIHTTTKRTLAPSTVYLVTAVGLQIVMSALRFAQVGYRNIKSRRIFSRARVQTITFKRDSGSDILVSDAVHVHVRLPRLWQPRAGQYVYLSLPGLTYASFAQSHPFYVAWWYHDEENGNDYVVFIVQRRNGFANDLFLQARPCNQSPELTALIEGPYGKELKLESYRTVILFATGIGVAGQIPYVTQILEAYQNGEAETQRIALFWEIDSEVHSAWVSDIMKRLLFKDTNRILDIKLFVVGKFLSTTTHRGDTVRPGERINIKYQAMDSEQLTNTEIQKLTGRTVVSLCTNDETSNTVCRIVRRNLDKDIHLEMLEFYPPSSQGNTSTKKNLFSTRKLKSNLSAA